MALDSLFGSFGGTRGSGFGGRATGGRFASIYGYHDGQAITDPQQMAQIRQQQNAPAQQPARGPSNDFFAQLAGLMGGAAPAGQPTGNPNIPQKKPFNLGQSIQNIGFGRGPVTHGGLGPYGGIAKEDQRKMFEGRLRQFGYNNPPARGGFGGFR